MTNSLTTARFYNILLWIAQILIAGSLLWASTMKLLQPAEVLAAMWPWTADHPVLVTVTGIADLLAGIGLIVPAIVRIYQVLSVYTAAGIVVLMLTAAIFHIIRGEAAQIGVNVFLALIALFIVWGRTVKAPVQNR